MILEPNRKAGRLLLVSPFVIGRRTHWKCLCDCGAATYPRADALKSGASMSCGCLNKDIITKHSMVKTPEYKCWLSMKGRCLNPSYKQYPAYGGRGIKVCSKWLESFQSFFSDMGFKPSPSHSLDRLNNDEDYTADNCRWSTLSEQINNRRSTIYLILDGTVKPLGYWADEFNIKPNVLWDRVFLCHQTVEEALTKGGLSS